VQYVNNIVTAVVNDTDDLRYAALDAPHNTYMDGNDQLIEGYEVGVGVTLSTDYVYGLPQRASDSFMLKQNEVYRLFNQDLYWHPYGSIEPLYGSWPYLTGHSAVMDASFAWMNSSETYVSVEETTNSITNEAATLGSFISVGGKFEFFLFGTTSGPKQNQKILSELTGYAPLPPIHSLGFHYCKYEENSANLMIERNAQFTKYGFPVDVFWSDLYYTQDFEYFVFNNVTWPLAEV
jgi:alpha 1,3-glucosidase